MPIRTSLARRRQSNEGTIVLRPSLGSSAVTAGTSLPLLVPLATFASRGDGVFFWVWVAIGTVSLLSVALVLTRSRLLLGWDGRLTYRYLWRSQSVEAAEIQAVTIGEGSLVRPLQVWTADRKPRPMPAVTETDLTVVGDWWLAHRGDTWQPAWNGYPPAPSAAHWWT